MSGTSSRLDSHSASQAAAWFKRLTPWLVIGGLILFHAINNWAWLRENVTLTGWDRPRHLAHSLNYARMLNPVTLRSAFEVMMTDSVRPPLFAVSATPLYWLFGWSSDVATMINIFYMAILLTATYGIGCRWRGRPLGLVSAVLLASFPMFYAMSRHFYLEFALTAMVALTVYLLLATNGFQRKGLSLLFGLSLGLGLLTKRTFAVFAVGPVIVAVLGSGLLPALWHRLRERPRFYWKRGLLALLFGFALAAIWYLPNRDLVQTLILGDALFLLWWVLATLAIYFITLPSAPLSNVTASLFLAAALASTWYLARIEFVQRMALYGYGVNDPRGRALQLERLDTYLFYVRRLANEHISVVFFGLFTIVLVAAVVVYLRRHGTVGQALRAVRLEGWTVVAWAGGAYVLLTFSIYQETRAFTPVLPAVALIFGASLLKLPWRRLKWGLFALVIILGLVQFFALSYEPINKTLRLPGSDSLGGIEFSVPGWGETSIFAQGGYLELPDEGQTDRGYWIQPDILRRMEERRRSLTQEILSLGLLARTRQINASAFIYLMLAEYPHLRVEGLIDQFDQSFAQSRLFAHDYVAVKRENVGTTEVQEQVIESILGGSAHPFSQAFELETTYPLPDGDSVYLYRQRYYLPDGYPVEYASRLAEELSNRTRPGDAILLFPANLVRPFMSNYRGPAEVYLAPGTGGELAEIAARHQRLFVVVGDPDAFAAAETGAGEALQVAQAWLNYHAFHAGHEWADSLQLLVYGTVDEPAVAPSSDTATTLGDQILLAGWELPAGSWQPGQIVPLSLFWQALAPVTQDWNVFVHLLDESGQLVAQTDTAPVAGSRQTSTWPPGEMILDRHGLLLPDSLPAGEYRLQVGMYLPATGERLDANDAAGMRLGDSIPLDRVVVVSP